jgi:hypothetical protein
MSSFSKQVPHGVPGQLNIYVMDVDSDVTGYGRHNRLTVTGSLDKKFITIREDDIGLPASTEDDRMDIANSQMRRLHPRGARLEFFSSVRYDNSIDWTYRIVRPKSNTE